MLSVYVIVFRMVKVYLHSIAHVGPSDRRSRWELCIVCGYSISTCIISQSLYFTVGSLSATLALVPPPHSSDYVGGLLCPLPEALESDAVECTTNCLADGCEAEHERCCPTTPGCRDCVEAIATANRLCQDETGNYTISPLTTFLNEEKCEFWWDVVLTPSAYTHVRIHAVYVQLDISTAITCKRTALIHHQLLLVEIAAMVTGMFVQESLPS